MAEIIILDQEVIDKLQRLHYDYENYKDVIATCLDAHAKDADASFLDGPIFKEYERRMSEAFTAYSVAKGEIEKQYQCENTRWNIDFQTRELTIG